MQLAPAVCCENENQRGSGQLDFEGFSFLLPFSTLHQGNLALGLVGS